MPLFLQTSCLKLPTNLANLQSLQSPEKSPRSQFLQILFHPVKSLAARRTKETMIPICYQRMKEMTRVKKPVRKEAAKI
jgi:hypothetical protein